MGDNRPPLTQATCSPGQPLGRQLAGLTAAANPDLDPGHDSADAIISYITQAITASDQPAR